MNNPQHANSIDIYRVQELATELVKLQYKQEMMKPIYEQIEKLTLELNTFLNKEEIIVPHQSTMIDGVQVEIPAKHLKVVDNFEIKNTVFRVAAVKRYEAINEDVAERELKAAKKKKKSE